MNNVITRTNSSKPGHILTPSPTHKKKRQRKKKDTSVSKSMHGCVKKPDGKKHAAGKEKVRLKIGMGSQVIVESFIIL